MKVLRAITEEQPRSSLDEVTRDLIRRTGVVACSAAVRMALRADGITRLKPARVAVTRAPVEGGQPVRYGYTAAYRREDGTNGMNTDLTDAEWALVDDLFERKGGRGKRATYQRRHMVNAYCYALRTGCAWLGCYRMDLVRRGAYPSNQTRRIDHFVYTLSGGASLE